LLDRDVDRFCPTQNLVEIVTALKQVRIAGSVGSGRLFSSIKADEVNGQAIIGQVGALVLVLAVHKALAAPAALTVATNMLFALVIGALLVHLLLSHRHGGGAGEKLPRAPWLYALGWLILGLTGIALVAGYPAFAAFVAERLVSILAVSGALYLLLALGRALLAERFALDTPRDEVIAANFGVSIRSIGFAVVLTYGGMCVAVLLAALVLYIGPW
jgi:small-conductance mechanosensitive channel